MFLTREFWFAVLQVSDVWLVRSNQEDEKNPSEFFADRLQDASFDHEKTLLSRQVEATDASIDKLVYELCGLTGG